MPVTNPSRFVTRLASICMTTLTRARIITAKNLPKLASAVGARFGEVKVTQIGGGGDNPFSSIAQAVKSVLELARDA